MDYQAIYDRMEKDIQYTASDLGVAGATMTAMVRRGLVEKIPAKPFRYRKLSNDLYNFIIQKVGKAEFFILHKAGEELGMQCSIKNSQIVDAWGKPYDFHGATTLSIYTEDNEYTYDLGDIE